MAAGVRSTSFYGVNVPRPFLVLDKEGEVVGDRVDAPCINDALIGGWVGGAATRAIVARLSFPPSPRRVGQAGAF